jgi:hypothetical protein
MATRKGKTLLALMLLTLITTGCAANTARIGVFAPQGKDTRIVAADKAECEFQAKNLTAVSAGSETLMGAFSGLTVGALIGASMGAIVGAFAGLPGEGAAFGAAIGGLTGGVGGAFQGSEDNRQVFVRNYAACLRAMGYSVGD